MRVSSQQLIQNILEGKFKDNQVPFGVLINPLGGARREYYSPAERSSYNYGYETMSETGDPQLR